jgi:hypothetical protein
MEPSPEAPTTEETDQDRLRHVYVRMAAACADLERAGSDFERKYGTPAWPGTYDDSRGDEIRKVHKVLRQAEAERDVLLARIRQADPDATWLKEERAKHPDYWILLDMERSILFESTDEAAFDQHLCTYSHEDRLALKVFHCSNSIECTQFTLIER